MASPAVIGNDNVVFRLCHETAPDIAGTGKANPTAIILFGGIMLDYLGTRIIVLRKTN